MLSLIRLTSAAICLSVLTPFCFGEEADPPQNLQHIGGKWYLKSGDEPVYYYKDGGQYVDLFSYHKKDSNKDGIDNVRLKHNHQFLLVDSQGYPNHPTAVFPNSDNPNSILVQDFHFKIPLEPQFSREITRVPMGPIGMAINGVVFFNPFEMGGLNAVEGYSEVWLDSCCGHPQQHGVYHYHKYPSCVKSPFPDHGKTHSPILGFAWDGFPVYGPYESEGVMAKDLSGENALDVCNGHSDPERGYHYHVTPGCFPYIIGGYHGVVERSNSPPLRRAEKGAIQNNAQGKSALDAVITKVLPGTARRGQSHTIRIELDPRSARHGRIPPGKPTWVQIGPFEADVATIQREGNVVIATVKIRDDAPIGVLLDCHIEFESPQGRGGPIVFKQNHAFRVIDGDRKKPD